MQNEQTIEQLEGRIHQLLHDRAKVGQAIIDTNVLIKDAMQSGIVPDSKTIQVARDCIDKLRADVKRSDSELKTAIDQLEEAQLRHAAE